MSGVRRSEVDPAAARIISGALENEPRADHGRRSGALEVNAAEDGDDTAGISGHLGHDPVVLGIADGRRPIVFGMAVSISGTGRRSATALLTGSSPRKWRSASLDRM
jgi:hypothetical protein